MTNLPKGLKIKLPSTQCGYTLTPVLDGTAHYKIVYGDNGYKTTEYYNKEGEAHRDGDKPAEIWYDGTKHWYQNGKLHRDGDKPAEIWEDGTKRWFRKGVRHRDNNKHALVYADGLKEYWVKGIKQPTPSDLDAELLKAEQDLARALKAVKDKKDKLAIYKKEQEASND